MTALPVPRFLACGDAAVTIEFSETIDPAINARVLALDAALQAEGIPGIVETVPTYRSLMVQFDPLVLDYDAFVARARDLSARALPASATARRWRVPVVYGGDFGIDLEDVAARHKLRPSQIIDRHAAALYRVYMIGFMPGFTYLGGLDQSIAVPRRLDPRAMTPAGTISIGGIQALIACQAMPSGWHLLGRTPVRAFLANRTPAVLFEPGDEVQFEPIDASRWDTLDQRAAEGDVIAELIQR
jgi:5-oxoprolinase (ATP-hydrolysing) subunit B